MGESDKKDSFSVDLLVFLLSSKMGTPKISLLRMAP